MGSQMDIGTYANAFCTPGERIDRLTTTYGVYSADGILLPDTVIENSNWRSVPSETTPPPRTDISTIYGPVLFAGPVDKQFGFVLLNSLGRLWSLTHLPKHTTIFFTHKTQKKQTSYHFAPSILRALGLENPIVISSEVFRFEELHTAPEIFGEVHGGKGEKAFYEWIDRRWPATEKPDPNRKLYVSRSALTNSGRFACEDFLEQLLVRDGYEIYYPEQHPLTHQVAKIQAAGSLVFAEGSALHLFGLIRQPDQLAAVINRRNSPPEVMMAQMTDRIGVPPVSINAVKELFMPPRRGEHLTVSVLDFEKLRSDLINAKMLSPAAFWDEPSKEQLEASLNAYLQEGEKMMTEQEHHIWLREWRRAKYERTLARQKSKN